jgi:hypothetical protein
MTHAERLREMAPRIRQDGQVFGVALKIAEADAAIAGADALDEVTALRARVGGLEKVLRQVDDELTLLANKSRNRPQSLEDIERARKRIEEVSR